MSFRSKLRVHFVKSGMLTEARTESFGLQVPKNLRCFKYVDAVSCFHLYKRAVGRRSACK